MPTFAAMNNIRAIFAWLLLVYVQQSMAQTAGTVIDMESHLPVKGVDVVVNGSYVNRDTTNYLGHFSIDGEVRDLTFIRQGYETRVMKREELTDTIELLPSFNRLDEVVIYGKMPGKHIPVLTLIEGQLKNMPKQPSAAVVGGDFLGWLKVFEKGHVSAKKRRERMKAIENY